MQSVRAVSIFENGGAGAYHYHITYLIPSEFLVSASMLNAILINMAFSIAKHVPSCEIDTCYLYMCHSVLWQATYYYQMLKC